MNNNNDNNNDNDNDDNNNNKQCTKNSIPGDPGVVSRVDRNSTMRVLQVCWCDWLPLGLRGWKNPRLYLFFHINKLDFVHCLAQKYMYCSAVRYCKGWVVESQWAQN